MSDMNNIFEELKQPEEVVEVEALKAEVETAAVDPAQRRKKKLDEMKKSLQETILVDPDFEKKVRSLSEDLEVINTLGFGEGGNIVVDKSKSDGDDKVLVPTSQIVGYRVLNKGSEDIKYQTEVYTEGEDGTFVGVKTEKVIGPGEVADINRMYMTMLCAQPEISFTLSNGIIVRGSGKGNGPKEELERHYFRFTKDEDGVIKQVNDDTVKLNVGEKVGDEWVVKPEFVEVFGFLNNKEVKESRVKKAGSGYTTQDLAANYINKMIQDAEL